MCRLSGNMYTICDKDLERLAAFSQLQSLDLSQCRALVDLRGLARLPQLRSLELNCCMGLKAGALSVLAQLPQLQKLDLCGCSALTDDCMEHITGRHTAISGRLPEHLKIHARHLNYEYPDCPACSRRGCTSWAMPWAGRLYEDLVW